MQINYSSELFTPYGGLIIIDKLLKRKASRLGMKLEGFGDAKVYLNGKLIWQEDKNQKDITTISIFLIRSNIFCLVLTV